MIIINGYAENNGKKQQMQKVQCETIEEAKEKIEKSINEVENGYNKVLEPQGLGKVSKLVIETHNQIIIEFTNEYILPTTYVMTLEKVEDK